MKVLIVASFNKKRFAPFILEQVDSLRSKGIECAYFGIQGTGAMGYLKSFFKLQKMIKTFKPTVIHAHYGLSGLLANLQRSISVITTYHGSDINNKKVLPFSKLAIVLSAYNIFVSQKTIDIAKPKKSFILLPCGVDLDTFYHIEKEEARRILQIESNAHVVHFAGAFENAVKNPDLAKAAIQLLTDVDLKELKGYTRKEVNLLMNAVDLALMTSFTEGSPQFIKEALACGCPVVSVEVGDVKDLIGDVEGCYIAERNPQDIANKIKLVLQQNQRINGKEIVEKFDINEIAKQLSQLYQQIQ